MSARILVAGGGPVGLAFACAVQGSEVTVLEASASPALPHDFDLRILAISPGSRSLLRDIGAWEHLDASRAAPVRRMEVWGDRGAKLAFSARPGAALAWIVEAGRLANALEAQALSLGHVRVRRSTAARAFGADPSSAWAELDGGERVAGDLLVGADGPDSPVRAAFGAAFEERPYDECALVANFATEKPHGDTARQWFRRDGVLAWLPLPGRRISIVWSAPLAVADELRTLSSEELAARVQSAGEGALGRLEPISASATFPLRRITVADPVAPGMALIGDAAHAVHPLAGQGVNLGFQDARVLADVLGSRTPLERPGDPRVLRRYARGRKEDVTAMQFVTDRLDRLFAAESGGAALLRNAGMRLVDSQGWAKDVLAGRAMR